MVGECRGNFLGIEDSDLRGKLNHIEQYTVQQIWVRGLVNHPEFTLHGIEHVRNVISHMGNFLRCSAVDFNDLEKFLATASAYLHDIGMLINIDDFIGGYIEETPELQKESFQRLEPEEQRRRVIVHFCRKYGENANEFLDKENPCKPKHLRDAELNREIHHLLSDWLINKFSVPLGISDGREYTCICPICRGHRKVRLDEPVYQDTTLQGKNIRTGIITAFLRIADELDFSGERIPLIHFEMHQSRLLDYPESLRHWIKHYYVKSSGLRSTERTTNPVFVIGAAVPSERKEDYANLLGTYIEKAKDQINRSDVKSQLERAGIYSIQVEPDITPLPAASRLPRRIETELGSKRLEDFARQLEERQIVSYLRNAPVSMLHSPPDNELMAKAIGYKRKRVDFVYEWYEPEICTVLMTYEIEAKDTPLHLINHSFVNHKPLRVLRDFDKETTSRKYSIECQPQAKKGGMEREYPVTISPPLVPSESLTYTLKESFRNLFSLTQGEVENKLRKGLLELSEPLECIHASISRPTDRLVLEIRFPLGFAIEKERYRVTIIGGFKRQFSEEKRRVKRFFKPYKKKGERIILRLEVPSPKLFTTYCVAWAPKSDSRFT